MKCTPDTPRDHVDTASLALRAGPHGRPVVSLRQHRGGIEGTTLVSALPEEGVVELAVAVAALVAGRGRAGRLHDVQRDPGGSQRLEDRREGTS